MLAKQRLDFEQALCSLLLSLCVGLNRVSSRFCFFFKKETKPKFHMIFFFSFLRRRFGTKCAGCLQGISPNDLVRKARSKVFHLNCFTCMVCNKQLSTGEELYVIDENKFVCKEDYMSSGAIKEVNLNSGNRRDNKP